MRALKRHLLHAIDKVLSIPKETMKSRLKAVSLKKLLKGEDSRNTCKVISG